MCVDENNNNNGVVVLPVVPITKPKPPRLQPPRPETKRRLYRQPEWTQFRADGDNFPEDQRVGRSWKCITAFLFLRSPRFVWTIPWSTGEWHGHGLVANPGLLLYLRWLVDPCSWIQKQWWKVCPITNFIFWWDEWHAQLVMDIESVEFNLIGEEKRKEDCGCWSTTHSSANNIIPAR